MGTTVIKGDSDWDSDFSTAIAIVVDEKASGTDGGGSAAAAFQTRVLNTIKADPQSIVSIATNEFTLQAGSYIIEWSAPAHNSDQNQTKLTNVTDVATVQMGSCSFDSSLAADNALSLSIGKAYVTIASAKAFKIEHYTTTAQATNGLGVSVSATSGTEIYTQLFIQKVKS